MAVCSIRIIIYLQVACYCIYGIHLPLPFEFEGNPYDEVKIMVWDDGSRFRRSADDTIIPAQNLEASFSVKQHPVNLRLSRNDDLTPEVPMYTANEDGIIKEDIKDDHFGSFFMENDEYFLEPNQRECTDLLVNSTFRVWRSNFSEIQNIDNIDRDIVDDYEPITRKENGRFKRNVADLKIETLFITDYSIYSYWYHKVTVKKESDRPRTTRSVIRQYYAFVINGMDVRFKNIPPKSSGFTISVVFSGIFIADTEAKSPFTEHHKVTSVTPNQVDAFTVLNHTATWLQQQTGLPGFDHAMMFSRYDFARGSYSRIVGKAFIGTMCTPKSVSIVEDRFSFTILEVAVHELGHSLNASHDGYGNQCSRGQYIMSRYTRVVKKQPKPWNFSTCSIQYFGDLIASLDDQGLNCMADLRDDFDPTALVPEINTLPGTVYDVDEHCRHIVGEGSSFCRHLYNKNNLTDLCLILYCYNTKSMKCVGYLGGDGLSCGNKKWCLSGVCTFSESAPTKNEECLFGDDPYTFRYGIRTIKCKGGYYTVQNSPDLCYIGDIRRRCCDTCSSVHTGLLGCEYGDSRKGCRREYDCYWYSYSCCQTCASKNSTSQIKTTSRSTSLSSTTETTSELLETSTVLKTIADIGITTYKSSKSSILTTTTATSKRMTTVTLQNTTAIKESSLTLHTAKEATMKTTLSTTGSTSSIPTVTSLPDKVSTAKTLSTSTNQSSSSITTGTITSSSVSSTSSSSTSLQPQTTISTTTQSPKSLSLSSSTTIPLTTLSSTITQSTTTLPSATTQLPTAASSTTTQSTTTSSTTIQSLKTVSHTTKQSPKAESSQITQPPTSASSPTTRPSTTAFSTTTLSQAKSSGTSTQHLTKKVTQRKMMFQISLNVFEKNTEEYAYVVGDSNKTLFSLYQRQLGGNFRKLQVKSVRLDPLIIDHDIFIENSPTTLVDVVNILKNISDGKTNVTYNGNDVKILFVSYTDSTNNQVLINDKTDPKTVIEASFVCTSDESCERTSTTSNADKDDIPTSIIISIAAVTALIVTCAFTISMACTICMRKEKPKDRPQYTLVPSHAEVPV